MSVSAEAQAVFASQVPPAGNGNSSRDLIEVAGMESEPPIHDNFVTLIK